MDGEGQISRSAEAGGRILSFNTASRFGYVCGDAAEALDFERAAALRDQIRAVERVTERQKIVLALKGDQDVIALAREEDDACVQVFFIRQGKLIGREYFVLAGTAEEDGAEIVASFVKQFYDEAAYVPPKILLPTEIEEAPIIEAWLREKRGSRVRLHVPKRGWQRELVQMATENAVETLASLRAQWMIDAGRSVEALAQLQEHLGLEEAPTRIEGANPEGEGS
ncbi:MAG TPA: hypothetical protein EYP06_00135 [Desulfobacterales bacterium]|nr:hypothetical protein [Desulfobacterales bacterium]